MMARIEPTIGRVVWYRHCSLPANCSGVLAKGEPWTAQVVFVHPTGRINVAGFDHSGQYFKAINIPLVQDGDPYPGEVYAEWMPYQKGQAAKTETLERLVLQEKGGTL
jgi:hypothetical protein